jgi:hypothetical protein
MLSTAYRWHWAVTLFVSVSTLWSTQVRADTLLEYQVKAALLYKVSKFVTWPDSAFVDASTPVGICVIGTNPFGRHLLAVKGKSAKGRKIAIKGIRSVSQVPARCHVLFVSASERRRLPAILGPVADLPVLSISDVEDFARQGGIMSLIKNGKRIGFEINVDSSERAGLTISAQLLELATLLRDGDKGALE